MKTLIFAALPLLFLGPAVQAQSFRQEALLITSPTEVQRVWIGGASKTEFVYYETEQGVDSKKMRISAPKSIWLMEPAEYGEAMELYQGRKYEAARSKFAAVRESHLPLRELPDNHATLAAFYEMESLRKLEKLDELSKAQETFLPVDRDNLSRENHQQQLELYAMWDAIRTKSWPRLETQTRSLLAKKMPGYQRAQAGYGLGLALEAQGKPIDAINAYNIAMTADTGASETVTRKAALNALRLYLEDESVQLAMKLWGTADEDPQAAGRLRLEEAAALASLFELSLGGGVELPEELKPLLKYTPNAATAP